MRFIVLRTSLNSSTRKGLTTCCELKHVTRDGERLQPSKVFWKLRGQTALMIMCTETLLVVMVVRGLFYIRPWQIVLPQA